MVVLWDPSTSPLQRTRLRLRPISDIDFAEGANALAVGGLVRDVVTVWRLESDRPSRLARRTASAVAVAIDGSGERVVVAGRGVFLHEVDGGSRQLQGPGVAVRTLAFSSRDVVAWGLPGRVVLWDASGGRRLEPLDVQGTPNGLDFSGTGLLAVAGTNGVTVWDPLEQRRIAEPVQGVEVLAVAIARSGDVLASATAGQVLLSDLRRDRTRFAVPMPENVSLTLALSPDEATLAVGTSAGQLLMVDTETGRMLGGALNVPGGPVNGLDFSPDGTMLATGARGGEVTLWDDVLWSDLAAMKQRLCEVTGRSLTSDEWHEHVPGRPYEASCP
jgi:WD40 repeat protein